MLVAHLHAIMDGATQVKVRAFGGSCHARLYLTTLQCPALLLPCRPAPRWPCAALSRAGCDVSLGLSLQDGSYSHHEVGEEVARQTRCTSFREVVDELLGVLRTLP